MLKNFLVIGSLASMLSFSSIALSQAAPTAQARTAFQIGAGYSLAQPDYGHKNIQGLSLYGDYDVNALHLGLTGEVHLTNMSTPERIGETSYLGGPRAFMRFHAIKPYAKVMIGVGHFHSDNPLDVLGRQASGEYFVVAPGAGVDVMVSKHLSIRPIDFEYQHWNFRNGLTPKVYTFGAAYRFH